MINRPPSTAAFMIGHAGFAFDQEPAAGVIPVHLRAGQQVNMIGEQLLQFSFRGVAHGGRFRQ
jgi:hypothetical protein